MEVVFENAQKLFTQPKVELSQVEIESLRNALDPLVEKNQNRSFRTNDTHEYQDPSQISYHYDTLQDKEISAFFAAIFAFGRRDSGISRCLELLKKMRLKPLDFVLNFSASSSYVLQGFKHRTISNEYVIFLIEWLQHHYREHESLESAFMPLMQMENHNAGLNIASFYHRVNLLAQKKDIALTGHVTTPVNGYACKRMCLYLRWMVRPASTQVDLGLWKSISPANLIMPVDVHVLQTSAELGLMDKKFLKPNQDEHGKKKYPAVPKWQDVLELTAKLAKLCPEDPVKYDFALFSLGEEASRTRKQA